ncbi:MAG: hypothetical protein WC624_05600 [Candidatus Margulisiibacteriota bacterium]
MLNYLLLLLLGMVIGVILFYLISRKYDNVSLRQELPSSAYSETEVEKILQNNGYKIIAKQDKATIITYIDGKAHLGFVVADYIVEKNGKRYAVEIKSGEGGDATDPQVRRKLLEYEYAHRPDGLLILTTNTSEIHQVSFELPKKERDHFFKILVVIFVIFVIIAVVGMLMMLKLI